MFGFLKDFFQVPPVAKPDAPAKAATGSGSVRDQAVAQVREAQSKVMTPERAELIRNAMRVREAKKQILADLSDEQRQRLAAMAVRAFLNEGKNGKK